MGRWSPSISATQTTKYDTSIVPGSPIIDRLDHPDTEGWAPRWKGRIALGWQKAPYSAGVTGRYVSKYFDYNDTTRTLGDDWYLDLFGSVELGPVLGSYAKVLAHSTATLNIVNATNRLPQYANTNAGYDHYQADIRGRYIAVQLSVPWQ